MEHGHQPRENAVLCQRLCGRKTWEYHGICEECGPQHCRRCTPLKVANSEAA